MRLTVWANVFNIKYKIVYRAYFCTLKKGSDSMTVSELILSNQESILEALEDIQTGKYNRVDLEGMVVYRVKNIIRIDIKEEI